MDQTWQCVLVCWGTKYDVALINHLVAEIEKKATVKPVRFVLISDREHPGLCPAVSNVPMPVFWRDPLFATGGCQAKLCIFERGLVPEDSIALYIDLDTVVIGDLSRAIKLMVTNQTIRILRSTFVPFGIFGRLTYRVTRGRSYPRGNSSFLLYHPAYSHYVAEEFKRLFYELGGIKLRPMIADERFISWIGHQHIVPFPKDFVVKLTSEYMFFWAWWLYIRAILPWVRYRRARQAAVTLNGPLIKPEQLLCLPIGARIVDQKSRVLVWSSKTLGSFHRSLMDFLTSISSK